MKSIRFNTRKGQIINPIFNPIDYTEVGFCEIFTESKSRCKQIIEWCKEHNHIPYLKIVDNNISWGPLVSISYDSAEEKYIKYKCYSINISFINENMIKKLKNYLVNRI